MVTLNFRNLLYFYFLDNHYTFQSLDCLKLKKNFAKITSFKHSYLNRIVDSWNNLGCEVCFSHDLHSLRHGVAKKLWRLGDRSVDGISRSR